jgi:hypothetical protein
MTWRRAQMVLPSAQGMPVAKIAEVTFTFQRIKAWKTSRDPDHAAWKARAEHQYATVDGEVTPDDGESYVFFCLDEFARSTSGLTRDGPAGRTRRTAQGSRAGNPAPPAGDLHPPVRVRYLFAAYDLGKDKPYGHIKPKKKRTRFLEFCRYPHGFYPPKICIAIVLDNFTPHLTTKKERGTDHVSHKQ